MKHIAIGNDLIGYDELVDTNISSKITGLSKRSLIRISFTGELKRYKVGHRTIKFLVSDLVKWRDGLTNNLN